MRAELATLLMAWRPAFERRASWVRAVSVLLGLIVATGRRTVTASIAARALQHVSWAADYFVFSRSPWKPAALFDAVTDATVQTIDQFCPGGPLVVALDDTSLRKTGKTIAAAQWMRDPLSPPFHLNLRFGLRYVHLAAILPLHRIGHDARAVSIAFTLSPAVKRPGKGATAEQQVDFAKAKKQNNLSQTAIKEIKHLRDHMDATGQFARRLLMTCDSSYTNRHVIAALPERVDLLGRTRKNLRLCVRAPAGSRKFYGEALPTPEQIRQDPARPWSHCDVFYGGATRNVRFKELRDVLWQSGAKRRPLRLIVVAPTPYRAPGKGKRRMYYRDPAYLLTTDLITPIAELLQHYFDRWQIEVMHRDLKTGVGVGQAQVHNTRSVQRLHSAMVAMWSMVTLAALRSQGPTRTEAYPTRPGWYPQQDGDRASQEDIVALLRADLAAYQPSEPAKALPGPRQRRKHRKKPPVLLLARA